MRTADCNYGRDQKGVQPCTTIKEERQLCLRTKSEQTFGVTKLERVINFEQHPQVGEIRDFYVIKKGYCYDS